MKSGVIEFAKPIVYVDNDNDEVIVSAVLHVRVPKDIAAQHELPGIMLAMETDHEMWTDALAGLAASLDDLFYTREEANDVILNILVDAFNEVRLK